MVTEQNRSENC